MMFALKVQRAFLPHGIEYDVTLVIDNEHIVLVGHGTSLDCPVIELPNITLLPGFIDLHIHGRAGADVMDATEQALNTISNALPQTGVTAWIGTTVTAEMSSICKAFQCIREYVAQPIQSGATLLGSFLEGPYFTEPFRGSHPIQYLQAPAISELEYLYQASGSSWLRAAIAPEAENAMPAIEWLVKQGIQVSVAHTAATFEQVTEAHRLGADCGVHVFNGMSGLHHRHPGCCGAVFYHRMLAELIADGIHVHPAMINLAYRMTGYQGMALITDCMRAGGLPNGEYRLGEQMIHVNDGEARTVDGSLAGSTVSLDQALRNAIHLAHIPEWEAVQMVSSMPADYLGRKDMGRIEVNTLANLTLVDDQHRILATLVKGQWVYINSEWKDQGKLTASINPVIDRSLVH